MVDTAHKPVAQRIAVAEALVRLPESVFASVVAEHGADMITSKGAVGQVASLAGIQAAKQTPALIPLCHHVALSSVDVDVDCAAGDGLVRVLCTARAADRTGVEMEAMTGASVAALAVVDMCKGAAGGKGIVVESVRLLRKEGGKSGTWIAPGFE